MEYTKGEWEVGKTPPLSNWVVGVNLSDPMKLDVVAQLYNNEADAHLIAAAPRMHEALKESTNVLKVAKELAFTYEGKEAIQDMINQNEQALAKAEGK